MPPPAQVNTRATQAFTALDTDHAGFISREQFLSWVSSAGSYEPLPPTALAAPPVVTGGAASPEPHGALAPPPLVYQSPPPLYSVPQESSAPQSLPSVLSVDVSGSRSSVDVDRNNVGEREIVAPAARAQPGAAAVAAEEAHIDREEAEKRRQDHRSVVRGMVSTVRAVFASILPVVSVGTPCEPKLRSTGFGGAAGSTLLLAGGSNNAFGSAALDLREHVMPAEDHDE